MINACDHSGRDLTGNSKLGERSGWFKHHTVGISNGPDLKNRTSPSFSIQSASKANDKNRPD